MKKIGYIYVLSNEHMPGLVKIGFTDRDPITRSKELSSHTGVPGKFKIEKSWEVLGALAIESAIFKELASVRIEGREFFKFAVPSEAIKRVTAILKQLGEVDASGETAPVKKRLAKQEKELKKEQDRLAGYKAVEQAWMSQQLKYEQLALAKVESRLRYSMALAQRERRDARNSFERLQRITPGWAIPVCIITIIGWPIIFIGIFIHSFHMKKLTSCDAKITALSGEVNKLVFQTKLDFFNRKGHPLEYRQKSARF